MQRYRSKSTARSMVMIPIIIFAVTVISFILAVLLEGPTDKGAVYVLFAFISIVSFFMAPLPCLIISVIGTVLAVKAIRAGDSKARKYLFIGIIEIAVTAVFTVVAAILFITGQSI